MSVALSYDDNGATASPMFVFVHGWTCDRSFFEPQVEHFGRNHRTLAPDLRGHGHSPTAPDLDYSIEAFAGDVAALIESLAETPVVLVGHSLGGVISCAIAAERPELVSATVMVDPAPIVVADKLWPTVQNMLAAIDSAGGETARAAMVDRMFLPTDDQDRKREIARTMARCPQEIAGPAIGGLLRFDGRSALARVAGPIATIASGTGANDVRLMRKANPRLVVGQTLGAGHFNQLEVPDQVNAMIEHFVRISL